VAFAALAGYDPTLVAGAALAGLALALQAAYGIPLQAELRLGWVTAADVARQFAAATAIVALALLGAELLPFFLVNVLAGLVAVAVVAYRSPSTAGRSPS